MEIPSKSKMQSAFGELEQLYRSVEEELAHRRPVCIVRGICCEFEKVDHRLYASLIEIDYAVAHGEVLPDPPLANRCRFHVEGVCRNREGRPLGCRIYFCDPTFQNQMGALYDRFYREIQGICRRHEYPWQYGEFVPLLKERQERVRREWR